MSLKRTDVLLCCGSGCVSAGALKVKEKLEAEIKKQNLQSEINIIETGCMGPCDYGPVMMVYPEGVFYQKLKPGDMEELVREHFLKGRPLKRLMLKSEDEQIYETKKEIPFYQNQQKIALENCGNINPEEIDEYIAIGGYEALGKILTGMDPQAAIEIIKTSGLRGRGGGGYPTWLKWDYVRKSDSEVKYVICNGDEGDPGAFMDRSLLEGDPHKILEGMMIAAYSIDAKKGYFYIRAEYPLAIKRIKKAVRDAKVYGILGDNIFNRNFSFDAEVRTGAGAFVCGEETALIASIEGRRGQPDPKPPYPSTEGLWNKPTLVNNVETLANIAPIFSKGAQWFAAMGTETSKGTKVFALTGDIHNTGLVEVPMGITLRELIYKVGGGIPSGRRFKAVQLGGPSGGCLTAEHLGTRIDYESLSEKGAMMGSGGVIVMDESNCMVNVAKYFLEFSLEESCGKCTPCRIGLKEMHNILEKITSGQGEPGDLDKLEKLGKSIKELSLCGLGKTAPNPVLSTLRYFRAEYEEHINDKRCQALVCKDLLHFEIDKSKCIGCGLCQKQCPVSCIMGSLKDKYEVVQKNCVKCGICQEVCPAKAISKLPGMIVEKPELKSQAEYINLYE